MLLPSDYESYLKSLASSLVDIAHSPANVKFSMMDIDDILSASKGEMDMDYPCMILENPEGKMGFKHDRMKDQNLGAFIILQRAARGDAEKKREVMDTCKRIGAKIVAKIQKDKESRFKGINTAPRLVLYFDLSEVSYNKIGPIFSDCYGWRFLFEIGQEDPMPYNEQDWTI